MTDAYKRLTSALLVIALVALFGALATFLVAGVFSNLSKILLIVGVALLAGYFVVNPEALFGAFRSRGLRYGGNTAAMIVLFIGIIGAGNWFTNQHSQTFDLTKNKLHTLSQETKDILHGLKQPVTATAFFTTDNFQQQQAKDLLQQYASQSGNFTYTIVDPVKDPGQARALGIVSDGTTVFQSNGQRKDTSTVGEQEYTSAVLGVTNTERRKIYFVTGNGQPDPTQSSSQQGFHSALTALQNDNYVVGTLDATANTVPDDAAALILAIADKPLLDAQKKAYADWLAKGGKMLALSAGFADNSGMNDLLKPFGLQFVDGETIDTASYLQQGGPQLPAVSRYAAAGNEIVKNLAFSVFPLASGIRQLQPAPQGITYTALATTSDQSWEQNHKDQAQFRDGDVRGPITLAASAEGTLPAATPTPSTSASASASASTSGEASGAPAGGLANPTVVGTPPPATATPAPTGTGTPSPSAAPTQTPTPIPQVSGADVNLKGGSKIVAVADTAWMTDQFLDQVPGNHDLLLNSINHLVGNQALISISPKDTTPSQVFLLGQDANLVFYSTVIFVPLAVLAVGGFVWWSRR
ncbi:MAG: GldG family protein [Chloroflexi bacterium]|nr:GldG family protein [Chloroflexota bacterium]